VGSTFRVYLPAIDTARASSPRQPGPGGSGTETVLLVEDEEPVRRIARDALAGGGYRVIDVASPWQALAVNESIDLLITDLVMPGMSGKKLAETLCRMRPDLPVLYMTGSLDDPVPQGRAGTVLRKPFSPQELVGRVREIFDAKRSPRE
jgi:DNA-binding response OmpR family regulator